MFIIKTIIYILIFSTCTYIGIIKSSKYSKRVDELKTFKDALNMFKMKIKFTYEPVPEIFKEIGSNFKNNVGQVFINSNTYMTEITANQAWEKSILETSLLNINDDDKNILVKLGKLLGKTDIEGQISEIELVSSFLDTQIEYAEVDKNKNEKLNKTLGMIVGLTIVILLI